MEDSGPRKDKQDGTIIDADFVIALYAAEVPRIAYRRLGKMP